MKDLTTSSVSMERTNVLLRNALLTLMMAKPFEKITLTDICKLGMIPRSTFYRHFEDKYDLLYHCFDKFSQDAGIRLDVRIIQDREQTRQFFISLFHYLDQHKAIYKKLMANNLQGSAIDCLRAYLEKRITENIIETFDCKIPNGLPTNMFSKIVAGIILSVGQCYIESDEDYDIEKLAGRLALCTDEGLLAM